MEETNVETKTEKEGKIIDFFASVSEEDNKRITDYLKEHPDTKVSAEELPALNNFLKETNFQSQAQKATLSLEEKLASAKTMAETEKILEEADLYRNPSQGHAKISPASEPKPLPRGSYELEQDEKWAEDEVWFKEFKKNNPNVVS